jgi:hypothetical protein
MFVVETCPGIRHLAATIIGVHECHQAIRSKVCLAPKESRLLSGTIEGWYQYSHQQSYDGDDNQELY